MQMNRLIEQLRHSPDEGAGQTDGQLLNLFVRNRDGLALGALVRRHAAMVWGVCRRILAAHPDAEDAFQATFLVLARKAEAVPRAEMVGNWLYGVARQTAVRMRALAARRGLRERQVAVLPEPTSAEEYLWNDLRPVLDDELGRLPEKYRLLLVLCDLEGRTRKEVAGRLAIPEGTVASRLAAARAMLAKRLSRRGVVVSGALLAAVLGSHAAAGAVPTLVLSTAVRNTTLAAAGQGGAGAVSPTVAALTTGVTNAMRLSEIKTAAAVLLAVGLALGGVALGLGGSGGSPATARPDGTAMTATNPFTQEQPKQQPVAADGEIAGELIDAATGKPVEGATVACGAVINDSGNGGGASAVTDARGRYRLKVPSPGIYNVWLKAFDKDRTKTAAADDGILVEARKVSTSRLLLVTGRTVAGKVVDADGKPVAGLGVSCHSPARPASGGVESTKTKADGTFEFALPPGGAYVYAVEATKLFGRGRSAHAHVQVPAAGDVAAVTLTLQESESKFGDSEWVKRSTPGTEIVRRGQPGTVTGTVVGGDGKPVAGAKVFRYDGPIVAANDRGEFSIQAEKGTQFIAYAFAPGYHVWFGTPTSGDVLKIVLERKEEQKVPPPDKKAPEKTPDPLGQQARVAEKLPEWLKPLHGKGLLATLDDNGGVAAVTAGDVVTDELLAKLRTLPKLRELHIETTKGITPAGLAHLAKMPRLEKLSAYEMNTEGPGLGDEIIRNVVGLESLRELSITECGTTDAGAKLLEKLPRLTSLTLRQEGRLTDEALKSIGKLSKLRSLSLDSYVGTERFGRMRFSADGVRHLEGLKDLESLHLVGQEVPADALAFPRLTALSLGHPAVDDAVAAKVGELRELRQLELTYCGIGDAGLERIAGLPELRRFSLSSSDTKVTDAGIGYFRTHEHLERVTLRVTGLTDESLGHLARVETLTGLDLYGSGEPGVAPGKNFGIAGLQQLKKLPKLERLRLSNLDLPGRGYVGLKELKHLRELTFMMTNVTDGELELLAEALPEARISAATGGGGWSRPQRDR
jgi:RNA polymerase sigma factor (sigma-70 family)